MTKTNCTKLKILKNNRVLDSNNLFTHVFEWYFEEELLYKEIRKVSANIYNLPETYDIQEILDHKKHCCLVIDDSNFTIEQVEL